MDNIHLYDKILSPLLTEKTTNLSSQNKVVFKVRKNANKKNLKKKHRKNLQSKRNEDQHYKQTEKNKVYQR